MLFLEGVRCCMPDTPSSLRTLSRPSSSSQDASSALYETLRVFGILASATILCLSGRLSGDWVGYLLVAMMLPVDPQKLLDSIRR